MPRVQLIPKGKTTAFLLLNGEKAGPLTAKEMFSYDIRDGAEISEEEAEKLLSECIFPGACRKAMDLIATQDRTRAELRDRLMKEGYGEEATEAAFTYVSRFPYLDDVRYALRYLEANGGKKSLLAIRSKLTEKGVSEADYEEALSKYREERSEEAGERDGEFGTDELELETLRKLIRRKLPEGTPLTKEQKEKMYASYLRKGFGYHTVRAVLKEYPTEETI